MGLLAVAPAMLLAEDHAGASSVLLNDRAASMLGAVPAWSAGFASPAGLTGAGQTVGLADSGVDVGSTTDIHPDLRTVSGQRPKVLLLKSWAGRETADDPIGHGTHMAASIAGTGAASDGLYRGIAPGASLYVQGLLDRAGKLSPPTEVSALFGPAYEAGVRIHVNGWGGEGNRYSSSSAAIDGFVRRVPDFLPVFGAGNNGPATGSLTPEANSKNALVVGASAIPRPFLGNATGEADAAAEFSSAGPTADGRTKPDLLVPASAVVSACSRWVEGNFAPNPAYTRMGGTSMAAALAGGATALLREQLVSKGPAPSAALMKALLVAGARPTSQDSRSGFGIMDISETLLAVEDGSLRRVDDAQGIEQGEERVFTFQVTDTRLPVRVVLAWSDPPGAAGDGRLVNDLDLKVQGPDGIPHAGNEGRLRQRDDRNNIEVVALDLPRAGWYQVTVSGTRVKRSTRAGASSPVQDFAVAYGQVPRRGTLVAVDGASVLLAGGGAVGLTEKDVELWRDGRLVAHPELASLRPGADVYVGTNWVKIVERSWESGAVQSVSDGSGTRLVEINRRASAGGYPLDPFVLSSPRDFLSVNGHAVSSVDEIQTGAAIEASVSPVRQTLWQVRAAYTKLTGVVQSVNVALRTLRLVGQAQELVLAPWAAVRGEAESIEQDVVDGGFAPLQPSTIEDLAPSMPVELWLSPVTGQVQMIQRSLRLVQGELETVTIGREVEVSMQEGRSYRLLAGIMVTRNGSPAGPEQLAPGDWVRLWLLPDADQVVRVQAWTSALYGRIAYFGRAARLAYLIDPLGNPHRVRVDTRTSVQRWGLEVDPALLQPGQWVRALLSNGEVACEIAVASSAQEVNGVIEEVDVAGRTLKVADGSQFLWGPRTSVVKNGVTLGAEDLVAGDSVEVVALNTAMGQAALSVRATSAEGIAGPRLQASAVRREGGISLSGYTSGQRLYAIQADGRRVTVPILEGGRFALDLGAVPAGETVLVGLDMASGGMTVVPVQVPASPEHLGAFRDLEDSPYRAEIESLAAQGVLQGYGDSTFRPRSTVSRGEFLSMLVRATDSETSASSSGSRVTDAVVREAVPAWLAETVATARARQWLVGYPDGSLSLAQPLSVFEAVLFVDRFRGLLNHVGLPPASVPACVPWWAREAYARVADGAIVPREMLEEACEEASPYYLDRGEAAAIVFRARAVSKQ